MIKLEKDLFSEKHIFSVKRVMIFRFHYIKYHYKLISSILLQKCIKKNVRNGFSFLVINHKRTDDFSYFWERMKYFCTARHETSLEIFMEFQNIVTEHICEIFIKSLGCIKLQFISFLGHDFFQLYMIC